MSGMSVLRKINTVFFFHQKKQLNEKNLHSQKSELARTGLQKCYNMKKRFTFFCLLVFFICVNVVGKPDVQRVVTAQKEI